MSRETFDIEIGLGITDENSDVGVKLLQGSGVPTGLGIQNDAGIGSIYFRRDVAEIYQKETDTGSAGDWILNGKGTNSVIPTFANKVVRAATGDALSVGVVDPSAFTDNDDGLDGTAYSVGEFLIGGVGGTPILYEVTTVTSGTSITIALASPALADNDGLIVKTYHPDPAGQENTAGVMYQNGSIIKLFDVDWSSAVAITLSSGYSPQNGTVAVGDSVEVAIEKVVGNQDDIQTTVGVSQGSTDMGTYTGSTVGDAGTVKQNIQDLETAHEEVDQNVNDLITLSGRPENSTDNGAMDSGGILSDSATTNALLKEVDAELTRERGKTVNAGVTTLATMDSVLVDESPQVVWQITVEKVANRADKRVVILHVGHNGHVGADATVVKDSEFSKLKFGANFNAVITADLNGAGGAQEMRLRVSSTEPSGVDVIAKRIETLY